MTDETDSEWTLDETILGLEELGRRQFRADAEALTWLRRLREAARERLRFGHSEGCTHAVPGHLECSCGLAQLAALLGVELFMIASDCSDGRKAEP